MVFLLSPGVKLYHDFLTWKAFLLVVLLLQYILWVATLVLCVTSSSATMTGGNSSSVVVYQYLPSPMSIYAWSMGQTLTTLGMFPHLAQLLTHTAWASFEQDYDAATATATADDGGENNDDNFNSSRSNHSNKKKKTPVILEIPTLQVQEYIHEKDSTAVLHYLRTTYGKDWMDRPVLLQGLWTTEQLELADEIIEDEIENEDQTTKNIHHHHQNRPRRRRRRQLTPTGLLNMTDLRIPYFTDARVVGALTPDGVDTVANIVRGILNDQQPYKIASQFILEHQLETTEIFDEIAPHAFLTQLFGNHFTKAHVRGTSLLPAFVWNTTTTTTSSSTSRRHRTNIKLPGTTTVPVFIANTIPTPHQEDEDNTKTNHNTECSAAENDTNTEEDTYHRRNPISSHGHNRTAAHAVPLTGLHCEPIANIAVQLYGARTWTLVEHTTTMKWNMKSTISADGRSFYPSWLTHIEMLQKQIPHYSVTTRPGDALWLPTWTYHKVEYTTTTSATTPGNVSSSLSSTSNLSIGASLFHFRPYDYLRKSPIFAVLLIPSLIKELIGFKTQ